MEWKSIKEQKPEDAKLCIVTHEDVSGAVYFAKYDKKNDLFFYIMQELCKCHPVAVTHWIAVPETPWSKKHPWNPDINTEVYKRIDMYVG